MEFLKNNKRFSFNYGGKSAWECDFRKDCIEKDNELITTYIFSDGLKVTNIAKYYADYGVYEWVNYFENTGDSNTKIISDLYDCDCEIYLGHEDERKWTAHNPELYESTQINAPTGSNWACEEFYCNMLYKKLNYYENTVAVGETKKYASLGGRSSAGQAPFFNVHYKNRGFVAAIGWTGQWNAEISRNTENGIIKTKIEDTGFYIKPKEKFRTSSIVIMPYEGNTVDSQNKWRRFMKAHICVLKEGETMPFSAGVGIGVTTERAIEMTEYTEKNGLPVEYMWMDAGWYGTSTLISKDSFESDWWAYIGDWKPNKNIHPNELLDFRESVKKAEKKFLLWFESERATYNAPVFNEHPEYFVSAEEGDEWRLLNYGKKEVLEYIKKTVGDMIEKLDIDCYRQDFNIEPLNHWRRADEKGRKGISEIKHINGLYEFLDYLRERFPNLIIDNCASGGKRIDIEMMKRSIPLWRSDAYCPENASPEFAQCHNMSFSTWIPYSGTGTGFLPFDEYKIRSMYAGGVQAWWDTKIQEIPENIELLKRCCEEYLRIREYFYEDVYPLTRVTDSDDVWSAVQFARPEKGDGIIQVFVRENAPYTDASYTLYAINEKKDYLFEDLDGVQFKISGKKLKENGFKLHIEEKRKAKIYIYKEI